MKSEQSRAPASPSIVIPADNEEHASTGLPTSLPADVTPAVLRESPSLARRIPVFVGLAVASRVVAGRRGREGDRTTWLRDKRSRERLQTISDSQFEDMVVIAAANPWAGIRMADRQLAEKLADFAPVLYVEPPTSFMTRFRNREIAHAPHRGRLRHVAPSIVLLAPSAIPGLSRRPIAALNAKLLALQVRRAARKLDGSVLAVLDAGILMPIMGKCGEKRKIYWAQDDFVGIASLVGLNADQLARGEEWMTRHADVVIAANPVVAASIEALGRTAELIPYGCDYDHFATTATVEPALDVTLTQPMAVFMGQLGDRIDLDLLRAVAARDINLLLVGPKHGYADPELLQDVLDRPNVQWVGARDFEQLPAYLAHGVVGLLPYTHSKFNLGSFPLKTLEYLAAGLPVVATSLPAIAWLDTPHISVADDPEAYADEVVRLLRSGRDPALEAARREFASGHTWAHRAQAVARLIGLPAPDGATPSVPDA